MSKTTVTYNFLPLAAIWILALSLGNIFHAISVSWWLVALPIWMGPAVVLGVGAVLLAFAAVAAIISIFLG